jgi:flagellin-like hook-associated protein FlgL
MQPAHDQTAELRAKDEAFERLRTDTEKDKAGLQAEIEKLEADLNIAKTQLTDEKAMFQGQLEALRATSEQVKADVDAQLKERDAQLKEKDLTVERMKEDVEGKEHNIEERDATIVDLRQQLEAEKTKEHPKPTPVPIDLIPEIDPWYASSLERYIAMLRREASEVQFEDKIKVFKAFLKAESGIRGIDYVDSSPQGMGPSSVPTESFGTPCASNVSNPSISKDDLSMDLASNGETDPQASKPLNPRQSLNVKIPQDQPEDGDYDFSPG